MTLAHLTGDDRVLTTAIATALRDDVTLDDGTLPLGIRFLSKHGHPSTGHRDLLGLLDAVRRSRSRRAGDHHTPDEDS